MKLEPSKAQQELSKEVARWGDVRWTLVGKQSVLVIRLKSVPPEDWQAPLEFGGYPVVVYDKILRRA